MVQNLIPRSLARQNVGKSRSTEKRSDITEQRKKRKKRIKCLKSLKKKLKKKLNKEAEKNEAENIEA